MTPGREAQPDTSVTYEWPTMTGMVGEAFGPADGQ